MTRPPLVLDLTRQPRSVRTRLLRVVCRTVAVLGLLVGSTTILVSQAQSPGWSEPIQLNTSDGVTPAIVVDNAGDVHVFWGSQSDLAPGALFHTRLSQSVWGMPTDVLLSPGSERAEWPSALVDAAGVIHLVWAGDAIYYSFARQEEADVVRGWSAPRVLSTGQATTPSIVLDSQARLHVLYADLYHSPNVRHTMSEDGGATWSEPVIVSAPQGGALAINADLAIDQDDVLHAIWAETIEDFPPSGVYYARSEDQGRTWSRPFAVAVGGYSWGSIGVDADNNVHLFWTGTGEWAGKYHRWSAGGGRTWTEAQTLWPGTMGFLNFAAFAIDSQRALHLVAPVGGIPVETFNATAIYHSTWDRSVWAPPERISAPADRPYFEFGTPAIASTVDGDIHAVWGALNHDRAQDRGEHSGTNYVLYTSLRLPESSDTVSVTSSVLMTDNQPEWILEPPSAPAVEPSNRATVYVQQEHGAAGGSNVAPLLFALLSSALVTVGALALRVGRRRR